MKNDLTNINSTSRESDDHMAFQDEFKVSTLGKIRKNGYYLVGRSIKFGLDIDFLMQDCQLSDRIINDLCEVDDNSFMFQNILFTLNNLTKNKKAIV